MEGLQPLYTERDALYEEAPLDSSVSPPRIPSDDDETGDFYGGSVGGLGLGNGMPQPAAPKDATGTADDNTNLLFSGIGAKLLKAAGWKEGTGLGKDGQGIVTAIQASEKHDRLGLGFLPADTGIVRRRHTVDVHAFVDHKQSLSGRWLECPHEYTAELAASLEAPPVAKPHMAINYDLFCSNELVEQLFAAKAQFDPVPSQRFLQARKSANPYELIGKSVFLNRAAVKMANMDYLMDYKLTTPSDANAELTFCDVCAGPGGFTEYVLWRREGRARGWGFTLKDGEHDFQPWKFNRQPVTPAMFSQHYGVDGTGDVTKTANIQSFAALIDKCTAGAGVDLMMADGGFSVEGDENYQEEHLKQLVLCQFLTALCVVREGGAFVCKVFDLFTPFSAGLVYILHRLFDKICIFKPYTSRPANSERYIVCIGLKARRPAITEHLFAVNDKLNELKTWGKDGEPDILDVVPLEVMLADRDFVNYVRHQNMVQAAEQTEALNTIMKYVEDEGLLPLDQADVRRRCLREWNLPETGDIDREQSASRRDSIASSRRESGYMPYPHDPTLLARAAMAARPMHSFSMPTLPASSLASIASSSMDNEIGHISRDEWKEEQRKRAAARNSLPAVSAWRTSSTTNTPPASAPASRRESTTSLPSSPGPEPSATSALAVVRKSSVPITPSALGRRTTAPGSVLGKRPSSSLVTPSVDGARINPNVRLRGQQQQPSQQPGGSGKPATPQTGSGTQSPSVGTATPRASVVRRADVAPLTVKRTTSVADLEALFSGDSKKSKPA